MFCRNLGCLRKSAALLLLPCLFCCLRLRGQSAQPAGVNTQQTISRRLPGKTQTASAALIGMVTTTDGVPVIAAEIELVPQHGHPAFATTNSEGIFRIGGVEPNTYTLNVRATGTEPFSKNDVVLHSAELLSIEVKMVSKAVAKAAPARPTPGMPGARVTSVEEPSYHELSRRRDQNTSAIQTTEPPLPPDAQIFSPEPDRWDQTLPPWQRFPNRPGDFPWGASSHWYDPFHVNRYKADKPIIGQNTFFDFTGTSSTAFDIRNLFVPSGVSAQNPGSFTFFGRGGQVFLAETARLSFSLFHGDTAFKPVDWQFRFTPAFNVNQLWTRERGIVNIDVRQGTDRTDGYVGIQEGFAEKKLADLGPNYDFISVRAGIQQFQSDFRGLIFNDEQPGVRLFGDLDNNRMQYNAAYFFMLEKNTNSGLNSPHNRHQQVMVANFYLQDFLFPGYTIEASYHYDKDDASIHYDDNGFLVRPAPIGAVQPHSIHAHYVGIAGEGHIKRINISHAFYQDLGHDSLNPIAGRRTVLNGQFAFTELSYDRDWIRYRLSGIFSSGDSNPRDHEARGFDSILDSDSVAGGIFSFFNREGIALTQTGVALTSPDSFIPDLRSNKEEGQANFVNPGLFLINGGVDVAVTTKMKVVGNASYLWFHHPSSLDLLLFQSHIQPEIGADYSLGMTYRPRLSENIEIIGAASALTPGRGLRQIYTGKTLPSLFSVVRLRF
jgi:hypothetical protein